MGLISNALVVSKLRKGAKAGDPVAQRRLGHIYYGSKGPLQDFKKAVELYRLAAEQGDAIAQRQLGKCYFLGLGVLHNLDEAEKWYRLAATHGDAEAQADYATIYAVMANGCEKKPSSALDISKDRGEPVEYTPQARDFFKGAFDDVSQEAHRRIHADIIRNRGKS